MMNEQLWKESIYSDGSPLFVSNQRPGIGERVKIRLRMLESAPISQVSLRYIKDGAQKLSGMQVKQKKNGLMYYETEITMTEKRLRYQFYLVGEGAFYCYTQNGLTEYLQNETYDFCLMADYVQPEWVKEAVFYQIFPERFCNGDPTLNVKDGEIVLDGFPSQEIKDWNAAPGRYPETHCMDFYGGDLKGIKEKIPYLKELGVTCIYLNPIFISPTIHKYDCIDYEHVDPHFGGDQALAELTEALHENGMKLLLDISVNHTGTDHKWFNRDCTYFPEQVGAFHNPDSRERSYYIFSEDGSYMGWLGHMNMPQLDYREEAIREKIYRGEDAILRKWLRPPYSIDGWRFDVADVMAKYGPDQLAREVWQEIRTSIREENPQALILAEDWTDCSEYLQGDAWDSTMNYYGCARVWRPFVGMSDPYLDSVMHTENSLTGISRKMPAAVVKERIRSFYGLLPFAVQQNLFNLLDSHDVDRLHNREGLNLREYRGAVLAQFTMLGVPSLYYGDEAAIAGYTDSIEGCRFPMPWNSGFEQGEWYALYRNLAHLRQEHRAFSQGTFQFLYANEQVISYARQTEQECWIAVISSQEQDREVVLPIQILGVEDGTVRELLEKGRDTLGERLQGELTQQGELKLLLPAHESLLFCL
ncbi:MAG: alpha amylase N-terminal ig-like domain-containing protein [Lachnospiraceae bacterium]|nr:alpha amylase N-terminal ig-like domain-containing protein [Lachnospiraceae bacterium]